MKKKYVMKFCTLYIVSFADQSQERVKKGKANLQFGIPGGAISRFQRPLAPVPE